MCPGTLVYCELLSGLPENGDQCVQFVIVNVNNTRLFYVRLWYVELST